MQIKRGKCHKIDESFFRNANNLQQISKNYENVHNITDKCDVYKVSPANFEFQKN